jgi:hypothetical protein
MNTMNTIFRSPLSTFHFPLSAFRFPLSALFVPLVVAGLLWVLTPLLATSTLTLNLGAEEGLNEHNEARYLYSFLGWGGPEIAGGRLARRGEQRARFALPWAFRLGSPLDLEFVLSGWGVSDTVALRMNETVVELPVAESGWRRYHVLLPSRPSSIYQPDLYLEWQSRTNSGPLLHQVTLTSSRPAGWGLSVLLSGITVALLLWLQRHQSPRQTLLWVGVVCGSVFLGRWLYEPQLLPWSALVVLGGGAAVLLTLLVHAFSHRLVLWLSMLWTLASPQLLGSWILDDAFISFRYAKNLVNGIGLTFNAGELVEGYTNFLWTMLMAGVLALGYEPVLPAQVLCTAFSLVTLLLVYRFARAWWGADWWCLLPPVLLASLPPFLLYTARGSGMETALVTLLTTATCWLIWRIWQGGTGDDGPATGNRGTDDKEPTTGDRHRTPAAVIDASAKGHAFLHRGLVAGLAGALLMMTRPDGVLVMLAGCLLLVWSTVFSLGDSAGKIRAGPHAKAQSRKGPRRKWLFPQKVMMGEDGYLPTKSRRYLAGLAGFIAGWLLLYAPYFAWRFSYYGYLLPNTFYAKVGATLPQVMRGLWYTYDFVLSLGGVLLVLLLGLSFVQMVKGWRGCAPHPLAPSEQGLAQRRKAAKVRAVREEGETCPVVRGAGDNTVSNPGISPSPAPLLWLLLLLTVGYVIVVGGDQFPLGRFFIPVLPAVALLITHGLKGGVELSVSAAGGKGQTAPLLDSVGNIRAEPRAKAQSRKGPRRRWYFLKSLLCPVQLVRSVTMGGILVGFVGFNLWQMPASDSRVPGPVWSHHKVAMKNADMGYWLLQNTPPDTVIATGIAGALPYYSERYVIDMLGLNDTHIAHLDIETMGQGIAGAEKTDAQYVFKRRPDYVPWSTSWNLQQIAGFRRVYERIRVDGPKGGTLTFYRLRRP